MNLSLSRRAWVRLLAFFLAALLVAVGFAWQQARTAADYRMQLEHSYTRSLGELSSYLTNIATDLEKGQYVGTGAQLAHMSARIWRECSAAKSALSSLPAGDLHLDETYRFLSQAGDYAMFLSKKVASGGQLTASERENARALRDYAGKLTDYFDELLRRFQLGNLRLSARRTGEVLDAAALRTDGISAGFSALEETMTGFPTLIYDGPFSDHLLTQRPKFLRGLPSVSADLALQSAARASLLAPTELVRGDDENSNMPCYTFQGGEIVTAVTKAGAQVAYLVNSRPVGEDRVRRETVFANAQGYLARLGIEGMQMTYYETAEGICTINFAAVQENVLLYTDLIKVGVALDDGGVVFYDARGYLSNHQDRTLATPLLNETEAMASLSPALTVLSSRLALIPTEGKGEVLAYEFLCRANEEGEEQKLLVYINVENGMEEQILLLLETPYGTLTK